MVSRWYYVYDSKLTTISLYVPPVGPVGVILTCTIGKWGLVSPIP